MIRKSEGIVLKTLPFQESHLITNVYTLEDGLQSFLLKGYRSSRSRSKYSYFQPLSIIDLVYLHKENQRLNKVRETKPIVFLHEIQTEPVKLSLGLACIEVFNDCVKEEETNPALYYFLKNTIVSLDQSPRRLVHIFIHFILHLTSFLGFFPLDKSEHAKSVTFHIHEGIIDATSQSGDPIAFLLRRFLYSNLTEAQDITFDQTQKRWLIKTLFEFYEYHISGFKYPQTLKVFAEVFS